MNISEMTKRLRDMAAQILTPSSSGKQFFNEVADELERGENSNAEVAEAFEQLACSFPQIQVDCDNPVAAAQAINAAYEQLRADKEVLENQLAIANHELDKLKVACAGSVPSEGHTYADEICGLLRVTRQQRDGSEKLWLENKARLEQVQKCYAEMRELLKDARPHRDEWLNTAAFEEYKARWDAAISSACGTTHISREELKPTIALEKYLAACLLKTRHTPNCICWDCKARGDVLRDLARIEKLMEGK